jgi:hypothetical protein
MILADSSCFFSWIKTRDPRMFAPAELRRKRNMHAAEVIFILDDGFDSLLRDWTKTRTLMLWVEIGFRDIMGAPGACNYTIVTLDHAFYILIWLLE